MNKKDRFTGVLFGQAIGDALGLGSEFMSKEEVLRYYPNGLSSYSQIIQDDHRCRWQQGMWTDDTEMMLCIADALIASGGEVNLNQIANNFKAWFEGNPLGIGRHTYNVLCFADYVKDEEHLNLLYCLTVADISATNDNVWNSWTDNIFRQLYQATKYALSNEGTDIAKSMQVQALSRQEKVLELTHDLSKDKVLKYLRQFPIEYLNHYQAEDISWHARNILRFTNSEAPLILFSQKPNVGTELMVYYKSNTPMVFGNIARTMAIKQLNVFSAQVFITHNFHALCTIMFQNKKGMPLDHDRLNNLRKAIIAGLDDHSQTLDISASTRQIFEIPTKISFLENMSKKQTNLEISTLDRQGLLAKIGITLGSLDCLIRAARITTTGERADDFFAITDVNGLPLAPSKKEELSAALKAALDG